MRLLYADLCCLLRLRHRPKKFEEAFHPRHFQRLMDALIHADQPKTAIVLLAAHMGPDQSADARRIRQRNGREVQDKRARSVGAQLGLEPEYIGERQRPRQTQNADSFPRTRDLFDLKWLIWHEANVNGL